VKPSHQLDWAAQKVAKAPGFRDATDVVELGAGDFSRSIALAERNPTKRFLSTDYSFSEKARANLPVVESMTNADTATVDARTIELPPASVDMIFSVALMEHVAELQPCLEAVERALRPGGVYFYIQAPFWSCSQGHHFRHGEDTTYEFIPKFSHLTHDRDAFATMLREGPPPTFDIDRCVAMVFDRPDLSRLGLRQTRAIVESGPLQLEGWTETPDRRYDESAAKEAFPLLRYRFEFEELRVCGAEVVLRKPFTTRQRVVRRVRGASRRIRRHR
jgi:SAM-dependent methyltransferase